MSNLKTSLKFNRKVYVIPVEKFASIIDMERNSDSVQDLESGNNDVKKDSVESKQGQLDTANEFDKVSDVSEQKDGRETQKSLTNEFKNKLSSRQYNNVMAIAHMIGFNPEKNESEREALLYTQDISPKPQTPANIVDLYHKLNDSEVPPHLITNRNVRESLERMSNLVEYDDITDVSDYEGDESEDDDILRKAWVYYTKEQERKRKFMKRERDRKRKRAPFKNGLQKNKKHRVERKTYDTSATTSNDAVNIEKPERQNKQIEGLKNVEIVNSKDNSSDKWVHLF
jgi:hypothetical protein